jgi:hypothetical protein
VSVLLAVDGPSVSLSFVHVSINLSQQNARTCFSVAVESVASETPRIKGWWEEIAKSLQDISGEILSKYQTDWPNPVWFLENSNLSATTKWQFAIHWYSLCMAMITDYLGVKAWTELVNPAQGTATIRPGTVKLVRHDAVAAILLSASQRDPRRLEDLQLPDMGTYMLQK